jgi:hypothetical protein
MCHILYIDRYRQQHLSFVYIFYSFFFSCVSRVWNLGFIFWGIFLLHLISFDLYFVSLRFTHGQQPIFYIICAIGYKHYYINVLFCLLKIHYNSQPRNYLLSPHVWCCWQNVTNPMNLLCPFLMGKMSFYIDLAHGDRYYKSHSAWKQQNEITSQQQQQLCHYFS